MGLDVVLEGEAGKEFDRISDTAGLLISLIRRRSGVNQNSCCLRFIDPYGNTVFNRLQMGELLAELAGLRQEASDPVQFELVKRIEELATQCQMRVHLYVKFYGD